MRPIPQTVQVAEQLRAGQNDFDVLTHLQDTADAVADVVPDCVGLSIAWLEQGVAFTFIASDQEMAVLDAIQDWADAPCASPVNRKPGVEAPRGDLLDEHRWHLSGKATAYRGVASTLTLALVDGEEVIGTANLYGASDNAFEGHHQELGRILGAQTTDVVRNADLSFSTRHAAEQAPATMKTKPRLDAAVRILVATWGIDPFLAQARLEIAADRAGITREALADAVIELHMP